MPIIAMSREIGSLGGEVARRVAEKLNLRMFPPVSMNDPATERGRFVKKGICRRICNWRKPSETESFDLPEPYLVMEEALKVAERGNALIQGWGAPQLLRNIPHVLTVSVSAPIEQRVEALCRRLRIRAAVARRLIRRWDAAHDHSVLSYFPGQTRKPRLYDMALDTSRLSVECCADMVAAAGSSATLVETPEGREMLRDRLQEARLIATVAALRHSFDAAQPPERTRAAPRSRRSQRPTAPGTSWQPHATVGRLDPIEHRKLLPSPPGLDAPEQRHPVNGTANAAPPLLVPAGAEARTLPPSHLPRR